MLVREWETINIRHTFKKDCKLTKWNLCSFSNISIVLTTVSDSLPDEVKSFLDMRSRPSWILECSALLLQHHVNRKAGDRWLTEQVYILSDAPVLPLSLHGSVHVFICILHPSPSVQQMLKLMYRKRENIHSEVLFKLIVNFSKQTRAPRTTASSVIFIKR